MLEKLLSYQKHVFPLVPEETVDMFPTCWGFNKIYYWKWFWKRRPDVTERKKVESKAYERIEIAILETDDFDKIIK